MQPSHWTCLFISILCAGIMSSGGLSSSLLWGVCSLAGAIASQEWIASPQCIFTSLPVLVRDKKQWVLWGCKETNKIILMCPKGKNKKKKTPMVITQGRVIDWQSYIKSQGDTRPWVIWSMYAAVCHSQCPLNMKYCCHSTGICSSSVVDLSWQQCDKNICIL